MLKELPKNSLKQLIDKKLLKQLIDKKSLEELLGELLEEELLQKLTCGGATNTIISNLRRQWHTLD